MADKVRKSKRKTKNKIKVNTYLEKFVSRTAKFKVDDLLDLYKVYEEIVVDYVFRRLLFPYTRFARTWIRDQARDLLAGTDRNRLILTSRARKATEASFDLLPKEEQEKWAPSIKPRYTAFLANVLRLLRDFDTTGDLPSLEAIRELGVSRQVYDDLGYYYAALMNSYAALTAECMAARIEGDHEMVVLIEAQLRALETEVGIRRDDAWYVTINVRDAYDQIERMVETVSLAYARLLFRFAHRLRGVTTTDENFSAGYEGMVRAARNYDPIDGSSFTAHCQWWVRSAVLQRQRQSSVISLPPTTWYQLSLLQRGEADLSDERVSDLKERAEMFYANSHNANRGFEMDDGGDDYSFDSIRVSSPDAAVVMGDSLSRSQAVEEMYEEENKSALGRTLIEDVVTLLHEEDPGLLFSLFTWAWNSGIEAPLIAGVTAPLFIDEQQKIDERKRHIDRQRKATVSSKPTTKTT